MARIQSVTELGQSIWYDYIQRSLIFSGKLHRMVHEDGLRGLTSNPSIFEKAIGQSKDYESVVKALVSEGLGAYEIYERIAIQDLQMAADVFQPVYEATKKKDGYVSLEVSPLLADDTERTVSEGLRLWRAVGRPNLMIKVPATEAGIPAIGRLLEAGVNVNVTLLFAVDTYARVFDVHARALEARLRRGEDVSGVASVASFFVSRIDTLIDERLTKRGAPEAVKGKAAIANAKVAYQVYLDKMKTPALARLTAAGAMPQRLLWASTSTKNKAYRDVVYIEGLIGPDTVNTVPEATYDAFKDHGESRATLAGGIDRAKAELAEVEAHDLSMKQVTDELLIDGVQKFKASFVTLLSAVERRRRGLLGPKLVRVDAKAAPASLAKLDRDDFLGRLHHRDRGLYADPKAVDFVGWLDSIEAARARDLVGFQALQQDLDREGIDTVALLGMGGSSLAPEVFTKTLGGKRRLFVLDSTVPAQVKALEAKLDLAKTLFVVASKSGSTVEPLSFMRYFYDRVKRGRQFVAVTDPGSKLHQDALDLGFRRIFFGEPSVGGRFSALSPFGLVAMAALGADLSHLLGKAKRAADACGVGLPAAENPGLQLGAFLADAHAAGRDKLTLLASDPLRPFGAWLEQLLMESTGKAGHGIVVVDGEPPRASYGADRAFAVLTTESCTDRADLVARAEALAKAGHPVVRLDIEKPSDVVQLMFVWEVATAAAGYLMGINPFDQPNVQEAKDVAVAMLAAHAKTGQLPAIDGEVEWVRDGRIGLYTRAGSPPAASLGAALSAHLGRAKAGDYVAINAFVEMSPDNERRLGLLRERIASESGRPVTLGFGPRFLHSTGQLHKGKDGGTFVVITADDASDLPVPGERFSFGVLATAQARGDTAALLRRGKNVLRIHLGEAGAGLDELLRRLG